MRRIRPDDGPTHRAIRLAALADTPDAFASSYETEAAYPDTRWAAIAGERSTAGSSAVFFAIDDTGTPVGLVGAYLPDHLPRTTELVSMWVAPEARGSGAGAALIDAVVGFAREADCDLAELWVTRGNDPAHRLYARAGFLETGDTQPLPSDPCKDETRMRLDLHPAPTN